MIRPSDETILAIIAKAAADALPAPTDKALGDAIGKTKYAAQSAIERLIAAGRIRIHRQGGHGTHRQFEIVATGQRTSFTAPRKFTPTPNEEPQEHRDLRVRLIAWMRLNNLGPSATARAIRIITTAGPSHATVANFVAGSPVVAKFLRADTIARLMDEYPNPGSLDQIARDCERNARAAIIEAQDAVYRRREALDAQRMAYERRWLDREPRGGGPGPRQRHDDPLFGLDKATVAALQGMGHG